MTLHLQRSAPTNRSRRDVIDVFPFLLFLRDALRDALRKDQRLVKSANAAESAALLDVPPPLQKHMAATIKEYEAKLERRRIGAEQHSHIMEVRGLRRGKFPRRVFNRAPPPACLSSGKKWRTSAALFVMQRRTTGHPSSRIARR